MNSFLRILNLDSEFSCSCIGLRFFHVLSALTHEFVVGDGSEGGLRQFHGLLHLSLQSMTLTLPLLLLLFLLLIELIFALLLLLEAIDEHNLILFLHVLLALEVHLLHMPPLLVEIGLVELVLSLGHLTMAQCLALALQDAMLLQCVL